MKEFTITYDTTGKVPVIASVPCGDCHACCEFDLIFLHPECGDNLSDYDYEPAPLPFKDRYILKHQENGACIYLTATGCSIHDKAPVICREYDCRMLVKRFGYTKSRKMVKAGLFSSATVNRGRELLRLENKNGKKKSRN